MTVKLTKEESEKHFHNALCNGSDLASNGSLDYSAKDYTAARNNFKKLNPGKSPCLEDVWMQILRDGKPLKYIDHEDKDMNTTITLKMIHTRVAKTPLNHLQDSINEQDDATTAHVILQTVIFGKVIYG